jgi:malate synthase
VAHPGLIETARDVFDEIMPEPNQINNTPHSHLISQDDLIKIPSGTVTTEGLSKNIKVSIQYMAAWLAGNGCVPLDNLMEDAATAEISRVQIWQWLKNHAMLDDEKHLNLGILRQLISLVMFSIKQDVGEDFFEKSKYEEAQIILEKSILSSDLPNFLTLMAYDHLIQDTAHEL